jgi:DNA polymerase-3 subunit beta
MKLNVTQENLARALSTVGRVASSKTSLPILGNIFIRTDDNQLFIASTNLEIAISERIGGQIDQPGSFTIPARLMSDFISSLPNDTVKLQLEGNSLSIKSGRYTSKITGTSAEEFPALPDIEPTFTYQLNAQDFKRAIQQTVIVASHDDTRPVLTGAYWHTHEGNLYIAATDGYRLTERLLTKHDGGDHGAIIPASTLQDVVRVLRDDIETIDILFDDNQVRFLMGTIDITSKLIDGKFPDYRQLIPNQSDITASLQKNDFNRIVKIASLFARESGGGVTLETVQDEQVLRIQSIASQLGENTSDAEAAINNDGKITLNSRYIIEALSCFDAGELDFSFSGKLAPSVIMAHEKNPVYKHVIMPLKS